MVCNWQVILCIFGMSKRRIIELLCNHGVDPMDGNVDDRWLREENYKWLLACVWPGGREVDDIIWYKEVLR